VDELTRGELIGRQQALDAVHVHQGPAPELSRAAYIVYIAPQIGIRETPDNRAVQLTESDVLDCADFPTRSG